MNRTARLVATAFIVLSLALVGAAPSRAQAEKVIRVGMWSPPGNVSAINADSSYGYFIVRFVFDTMVNLEPDFSFSPRLADAWEISRDGRTYTFHLNPNATWHDGKPITAADVLFTIETVATPGVQTNRGSALRAIEGLDANGKMTGETISGVRVVDAHTIAITTKSAVDPARFLEQFGTGLYVIPKHLLEGLSPDELARSDVLLNPTVGSGPFRFVRYVTDQYVELERYDAYHRGPAKVDRIFVRIVPAPSVATQLIRGEIDVVAGPGIGEIPLEDWPLVQKAENLRTVTEPALGYQFMAINSAQPYFQDARVRKALALAINRKLMVDQLYQGEAALAVGPFSPITPYANENLDPIPNDPQQARQLLTEAGWDFGRTVELLVPTGNVLRERSASIIQANLQAVGMQVRIQRLDFPSVLSRVFADDFDLTLLGWTDTFDPDHVSSTFQTGGQYNLGNFSDPEADRLIEAAGSQRDPARRKVLYDQLQVLFQEKVPAVFLYYPNMLTAVSKRLVDADPSVFPFENWAAGWDIQEAK
ncbi:ABC transporter substrate-binding protein [Limnochorda pilosa]|uniref:Oligopeptide-binding protein AppA n=1 Tax=Limnochorda pilosa TaxID=1555112 RepID=A0A0K2SLK4_LIMPI|nr:ABC transporter substrate-binding protein [Limnochorda pilosa]BAS27998.1 oligopeptide-binding protein AppA [Limnochorda pilosa]